MTSERGRNDDADKYRNLFEGAQASLADLSARQAQALSRVGRLRNAVVTVLRRNFMELSAEAEAQLGRRLSEVDDEILIAYLDAFVSAASRGDQRATLQAMAEAITGIGVPLRGDEPLLWVEQIHEYRNQQRQAVKAPSFDRTGSRETTSNNAPAPRPIETPVNPPHDTPMSDVTTPKAPVRDQEPDDYWGWDPGTTLKDLFTDEPAAAGNLGSLFNDVERPVLWDNDLGKISEPEEQWTPSPVLPASEPAKKPAQSKPAEPRPAAAKPSQSSAAPPKAGPTKPVTPSVEKPKTKQRTAEQPEPKPAVVTADATPPSRPAEDATTPDTAKPVDVTPGEPERPFHAEAPGESAAPRTDPGAAPAVEAPLRPELFAPQPAARRKRTREVRTQARAPEEALPFVNEKSVLDDQMRRALLAACSIPRPVFTRDLIAVAGSDTVVDAWEAECRAEVSTSPVRFVAPKSRHRQRGRLVAVEQDAPRPQDWWYQAVSRYRAGRLYELGVLLHRVGDEIVSFQLGEQVCCFRLNTPRGLVGIVVVLDVAAQENQAVIEELNTTMEQLLTERLTLLAVLTASGEPGSLEDLVATLEQAAQERSWRPTSPIVAARSWEYADDRGSSAVMVLNQA